ncbi:serine protease SP24D-like [Aedes albopictus]|uniref:Peptidase S1 domain-containing protein n=1 Tax=Aedes albopictus TaxID=7160 RepID=A0ABM1XWW3_AEDAL
MEPFLLLLLAAAFFGAVAPSPARRIVGGQFAENEKQFPYQAALFEHDEFKCGGSIIAEKWILTATHCITEPDGTNTPTDSLKVLVGSHHLKKGGKKVKIAKIIPYVDDDYPKIKYDIGLIKLEEALVLDTAIQTLELYRGELPVNATVTISGHGKTGSGEPISEVLKHNTMIVLSEGDCSKEVANSGSKKIFCVNNAVDNGVCSGDSGSPAVYEGKQLGVANFVMGKCGSERPDGYAFVPFFVDWIEKTMEKE